MAEMNSETQNLRSEMQDFPLLLIPTFNNPTYLNNMLAQLAKMKWLNFLIIDSGSTFPDMLELMQNLPTSNKMILENNLGPRFFSENQEFFKTLPDIFCVTDPDLEFNIQMPLNFAEKLTQISNEFQIGKVGLALDISVNLGIKSQKYILESKLQTIQEYERKYWEKPIKNVHGLEIYEAPVDTTFALYNKRYFNPAKSFTKAFRVAGKFSAIHLPWLDTELRPTSEIDFYNSLNKSGAFHEIDGMHLRLLQEIEDLKRSLSWRVTKPLRGVVRIFKNFKKL
jgi:hypothetical protein